MTATALAGQTADHILAGRPSHPAKGRAYLAGWLSVAVAVPVATLVLRMSGVRFVAGGFLPLAILAAMLGIAHVVYDRLRPHRQLALASGVLAMLIAAGILAAIISHAGLRLRYPFVDPLLSAIDEALGIDTPRVALALALDPFWGGLLDGFYLSAFPAVFLTAIYLGFSGREERAWELGFCFSSSIVIASAISVFFPAVGSMVHHHIDETAGLPAGAGNYYLATVRYFREATVPELDVAKLSGVVAFPSFHMAMALMVPYAFRNTGLPGWAAIAWSMLVTASTIGIGGHYVVDLVGGALLWAAAAYIARPANGSP